MDCNNPPIGRLVGIVSNMMHRVMLQKFAGEPYGTSEAACISYICGRLSHNPKDSVFQRDIEKEFNLRSPTASETIKNLEQKGLIVRESVKGDGRKKKLIPTEAGLEYSARIRSKLHEVEQLLIKDISEEDLQTYRAVSQKIIDNLKMEEING